MKIKEYIRTHKHVWLLLGWVTYFTAYALTERFIPESRCHLVHSVVDDMVPFNEYFVLAYCYWYLLCAGSLFIFLLKDTESFKKLQFYIIVTQVVATIVYICWPSIQDLRPASFEHQNFCTWLLGIIYAADTPTGVCPSLHVGYSLGIASVWLKKKDASIGMKIFVTLSVLLICVSILFVKQHSFYDILAAIPMCIFAEYMTFHCKPLWKWLDAKLS